MSPQKRQQPSEFFSLRTFSYLGNNRREQHRLATTSRARWQRPTAMWTTRLHARQDTSPEQRQPGQRLLQSGLAGIYRLDRPLAPPSSYPTHPLTSSHPRTIGRRAGPCSRHCGGHDMAGREGRGARTSGKHLQAGGDYARRTLHAQPNEGTPHRRRYIQALRHGSGDRKRDNP